MVRITRILHLAGAFPDLPHQPLALAGEEVSEAAGHILEQAAVVRVQAIASRDFNHAEDANSLADRNLNIQAASTPCLDEIGCGTAKRLPLLRFVHEQVNADPTKVTGAKKKPGDLIQG